MLYASPNVLEGSDGNLGGNYLQRHFLKFTFGKGNTNSVLRNKHLLDLCVLFQTDI